MPYPGSFLRPVRLRISRITIWNRVNKAPFEIGITRSHAVFQVFVFPNARICGFTTNSQSSALEILFCGPKNDSSGFWRNRQLEDSLEIRKVLASNAVLRAQKRFLVFADAKNLAIPAFDRCSG
jgi:hypothetical protein